MGPRAQVVALHSATSFTETGIGATLLLQVPLNVLLGSGSQAQIVAHDAASVTESGICSTLLLQVPLNVLLDLRVKFSIVVLTLLLLLLSFISVLLSGSSEGPMMEAPSPSAITRPTS